jgi:hypothetical protein
MLVSEGTLSYLILRHVHCDANLSYTLNHHCTIFPHFVSFKLTPDASGLDKLSRAGNTL